MNIRAIYNGLLLFSTIYYHLPLLSLPPSPSFYSFPPHNNPSRLYQFAIVRDISRDLLFQPSLRLTGTRYLKSLPRNERTDSFSRDASLPLAISSTENLTIFLSLFLFLPAISLSLHLFRVEEDSSLLPTYFYHRCTNLPINPYERVVTRTRVFESRLFRVRRREGERPAAPKGHG